MDSAQCHCPKYKFCLNSDFKVISGEKSACTHPPNPAENATASQVRQKTPPTPETDKKACTHLPSLTKQPCTHRPSSTRNHPPFEAHHPRVVEKVASSHKTRSDGTRHVLHMPHSEPAIHTCKNSRTASSHGFPQATASSPPLVAWSGLGVSERPGPPAVS